MEEPSGGGKEEGMVSFCFPEGENCNNAFNRRCTTDIPLDLSMREDCIEIEYGNLVEYGDNLGIRGRDSNGKITPSHGSLEFMIPDMYFHGPLR